MWHDRHNGKLIEVATNQGIQNICVFFLVDQCSKLFWFCTLTWIPAAAKPDANFSQFGTILRVEGHCLM